MIREISFLDILPIWRDYLWVSRISDIESNSAMNFLGGYDLYNMTTKPTFLAYVVNNTIVGVNSGHMCTLNQYRSRGLFVFEEYRGRGIGSKLLIATIDHAKSEEAELCWSYPRESSWLTYRSAGFTKASEYTLGETGNNCYCKCEW